MLEVRYLPGVAMVLLILTGIAAVRSGFAQAESTLYPGAANAASYAMLDTAGAGLAPGSLIVVRGSNLGPAVLVPAREFPLPTELSGTRVTVGGQAANLVYASLNQIAAIVPSSVPLGLTRLLVTWNGRTSEQQVNIIPADFGIFTRNSAGYGPAALQNYVAPTGQVIINGLASPAIGGQTVILYGTGLGSVGAPDDRPPGAAVSRVPVEVLIEGRTIFPSYAGRSPEFPGLDQINFVLPDEVPDSCYVRVAIRAGGRLSNEATLSKISGGAFCDHPLGFSPAVLRNLDAGQTATVGYILLGRNASGSDANEGVEVSFAEGSSGFVYQLVKTSARLAQTRVPAANSCTVDVFRPAVTAISPGIRTAEVNLDAGATLRLTGPGGKEALVLRDSRTIYNSSLSAAASAPFLQGGEWTLQGSGGTSIGPLLASLRIPDPLQWISKPQVIDRTRPLEVQWTGGGTSNEIVIVGNAARTTLNPEDVAHTSFTCRARAADQRFTIPTEILRQLPETTEGLLEIRSDEIRTPFTAPLIRGGQLDAGIFMYRWDEFTRVTYR